jgi:hypothetical protein
MKRKLLILNVALLIIISFGLAELMNSIKEADSRREALLGGAGDRKPPVFPASEEAPRLRPADFRPIVDRLLFSPDRNPVIEVEEPIQERGNAARPAYPLLVGVMDFGDGPIAMLSETARGTPRPVSVGEKVGEFTFLTATEDGIVLEWSGRKFEVTEEELVGTTGGRVKPKTKAGIRASTSAIRSTSAVRPVNLSPKKTKSVSKKYYIGVPLSGQAGRRAADPNDGVPDGTTTNGWVRRVRKTPFGSQHWWEAQPR